MPSKRKASTKGRKGRSEKLEALERALVEFADLAEQIRFNATIQGMYMETVGGGKQAQFHKDIVKYRQDDIAALADTIRDKFGLK
jgi:hypothetical protein